MSTDTALMNLPVNYDKLQQSERRIVRNEYQRIQGGKCSHCGTSLASQPREDIADRPVNRRLFPKAFFRWPVHLHHSHKTGMTIGAVHAQCNAVLWQYHGE